MLTILVGHKRMYVPFFGYQIVYSTNWEKGRQYRMMEWTVDQQRVRDHLMFPETAEYLSVVLAGFPHIAL